LATDFMQSLRTWVGASKWRRGLLGVLVGVPLFIVAADGARVFAIVWVWVLLPSFLLLTAGEAIRKGWRRWKSGRS
jgi:hypothetical protein